MTYAEILAAINAYVKRQETQRDTEMRIQSTIAYHQANQISVLVGRLVGNKNEVPTIDEAYPRIFPEMERKAELDKAQQQHWQIMKSRIEAYAANAAEKRKRGERLGNHVGRTPDTDNVGNV